MIFLYRARPYSSHLPEFELRRLCLSRLTKVFCWLACVVIVTGMSYGQDNSVAPATVAWEYHPYKVVVWVAHDNSYKLKAIEPRVLSEVKHQSVLADPSGWSVTVIGAERPWSRRILWGVDQPHYIDKLKEKLQANDLTADADKLIVVALTDTHGEVNITVQELDLKTEIWGARIRRVSDYASVSKIVFDAIATAFMPIARIERVDNKDVRVRVRASGIVHRAEEDAEGNWTMKPNVDSPVYIGDEEILLPVIIRKNRRGNVEKGGIKPVEWTFLSVVDREGPHLNCETHAMLRAPLGGRTGGRTERLGLCVRAPNRSSVLRLVSNDSSQQPLPDLEVFSRRPGMAEGEGNEFLGKTNWRGEIEVPPSEYGIRILLVKSGERRLARVPVVPGLHAIETARMPNDKKRLYAEGIVRGLQNKLMDNLAKRQIIEARIARLIDKKDFKAAGQQLRELRGIEDSRTFNVMLGIEKKKLESNDERENEFIVAMFDELSQMSSKFLTDDAQIKFAEQIRDASDQPSSN